MDQFMQMDWSVVLGRVGLGAVLGISVGYATKKAIKIALIILACILTINLALYKIGFVSINWTLIDNWWNQTVARQGAENIALSWIGWFTSSIALSGSFIAGFLFGFRSG